MSATDLPPHVTRVGRADAPRVAYILHGILGSGRNWRGLARTLTDRHPDWQILLPDLRNHGDAPHSPPPHTLAATADDLAVLPRPELVVGHSFGGKVALAWAEAHPDGLRAVWVLDSLPGPVDRASGPADAREVFRAVRAVPVPAADRHAIRDALRAAGLSEAIIMWLATSLEEGPDGWRWKYDVDGIDQLLEDYFDRDFWPLLERAADGAPGPRIRLLRAGRSDRWTPDVLERLAALQARGGRVTLDTLPRAGHWLHVDDPAGTLAAIEQEMA